MTVTNSRLIRALLRQPVDKIPVWLMRQAGRYLPEYRALRAQRPDFMAFCRTPELATQATLQPLARYDLDAAILFSDILVVPAAMGMTVQFIKGEGPHFPQPLRSRRDIHALRSVEAVAEMDYVMEAITLIRKNLTHRLPLIGFAGSPWTCATYMIEGGSSRDFAKIKSLRYQDPEALHELLQRLADFTLHYLNAQIAAGAQVIMLFDTWGGVLAYDDYPTFSLHYLQHIAHGLTRRSQDQIVPVIFFTKGGGPWLEMMADSGCDAVGIDWTVNLAQARRAVKDRVALQGNLDSCALLGDPQSLEQAVRATLTSYGHGPGHIFNCGHGILPQTPPEHVKILVDAVHNFNQASIA